MSRAKDRQNVGFIRLSLSRSTSCINFDFFGSCVFSRASRLNYQRLPHAQLFLSKGNLDSVLAQLATLAFLQNQGCYSAQPGERFEEVQRKHCGAQKRRSSSGYHKLTHRCKTYICIYIYIYTPPPSNTQVFCLKTLVFAVYIYIYAYIYVAPGSPQRT